MDLSSVQLCKGLWLIGVVVDTEHLYPFAIVKVSVAVCKGAVEELVDLDEGEWGEWRRDQRHLLLVHAFADVAHPLAEFVDLDSTGVGLVETLECLCEIGLWVELDETFAHHGEEHGKVDARVGGEGGGRAGACSEEAIEHGLGGGYAWRWDERRGRRVRGRD